MPSPRVARALRRRPTDAERILWHTLRAHRFADLKFRRQQPLGPYVVDFVCLSHRLVIELDGDEHTRHRAADRVRERWLEVNRFRTIRFSDREVLTELEGVATAILLAIAESPSP